MNSLKFLKGLKYFLDGSHQNQNEIVKFINYCKSFENKKGYLTQSFFKNIITKKAKFISGPFTNMIFEILVFAGGSLLLFVCYLRTKYYITCYKSDINNNIIRNNQHNNINNNLNTNNANNIYGNITIDDKPPPSYEESIIYSRLIE